MCIEDWGVERLTDSFDIGKGEGSSMEGRDRDYGMERAHRTGATRKGFLEEVASEG